MDIISVPTNLTRGGTTGSLGSQLGHHVSNIYVCMGMSFPSLSRFFLVGGSGYKTGKLKLLQASMYAYICQRARTRLIISTGYSHHEVSRT